MEIIQTQADTTQSQTFSVPSQQTQSPEVKTSNDALFLFPIGFLVLWTIAVFVFLETSKLRRGKELLLKHFHRIPCRNCRYYSDNPYMKCAVNPAISQTREAANCQDFESQKTGGGLREPEQPKYPHY